MQAGAGSSAAVAGRSSSGQAVQPFGRQCQQQQQQQQQQASPQGQGARNGEAKRGRLAATAGRRQSHRAAQRLLCRVADGGIMPTMLLIMRRTGGHMLRTVCVVRQAGGFSFSREWRLNHSLTYSCVENRTTALT